VKTAILDLLKGAGPSGITVKEIAAELGVNYNRIFTWLYKTGKTITEIKKVGPRTYGWASATASAVQPPSSGKRAPAAKVVRRVKSAKAKGGAPGVTKETHHRLAEKRRQGRPHRQGRGRQAGRQSAADLRLVRGDGEKHQGDQKGRSGQIRVGELGRIVVKIRPSQRSHSRSSVPLRRARSATWSRSSLPTAKYFDLGCAKYRPLTLDPGVMAKLSVSRMPARCSTSKSLQSCAFSVWSGHAG